MKGLLYSAPGKELHVCGTFSLGSCSQTLVSLSSPALNRLSSREEQLWYLLTVDKLVVKEKKHPLLAPGLWLGNTSQLPRVDEFRAPDKEIFPLGDPKESNELNAPTLEL